MSIRLRRILLGILAALIVIAVALAALIPPAVRRSFPQIEGTLQIAGLQAPVEVIRDDLGIPHIYASNEHDLFMAQGYVHAQDRFWQMDFWRHIGAGRLAEMFGESQVETDQFLRTLGWARIAQQELDRADPDTLAILQAYADGVNAYLADRRGTSLSLEHGILRLLSPDYEPEPWGPLNTLTWIKVMAWDLGGNMDAEMLRARMLKNFGAERTAELFPLYPKDAPIIVPEPAFGLAPGTPASPASAAAAIDWAPLARRVDALNSLLGAGFRGIGSNNWTVSGQRTTTGAPILANDPHLGIQMPSIWYEVGLHCQPKDGECRFNVVGFSFAGAPGVVIGHNDRIAWGMTNVGPDVQDLYIEKLNPQNPNQYEVNGEWVDMQLVQETIQVAGGDPVPITVRYTRHGPLLSDVDEDLAALQEATALDLPPQYAVSLRWTALEPTRTMDALLWLNAATDWDSFRDALRDFAAPSQNFVYADVDGNIGYQTPGLIPIRANGDGLLPVPGWTDDYEWTRYIPFDELPRSFNPPRGYIVTANNAVVGPDYPYMISLGWDYGYRARRIIELIEAKQKLSLQDMAAIQGDNFNAMGPVLVPLLKTLNPAENDLQEAVAMLHGWDYQNDSDSAPAALFNAFWRHLILSTFGDEFPQAEEDETNTSSQILGAADMPSDDRAFLVIEILVEDPDNAWWDDITTPEREDRDAILTRALQAALQELHSTLGKDPASWSWGALHGATFRNATLGESGIAPLEALFNRGPFPVSGGSSIVNANGWDFSQGYDVTWVPSMRMLVDLGDLSNSLSMHTTGQSGHPYHPHYIDMAPLWSTIQFHPMRWTRQQVEAAAEGTLRLIP